MLDCLPFFVEPLENTVDGKQRRGSTLLQAHYPYKAVGFKDLVIPRGTLGEIEGKMICWETRTSLWDVAVGEIELLLQQVRLLDDDDTNQRIELLKLIRHTLFV